MKTKHTETPWHCTGTGTTMRKGYSQPFCIHDGSGTNLIAGLFGDVRGGEPAAEANAKFICLADLVAALSKFMLWADSDSTEHNACLLAEAAHDARAILARATSKA